jgi:predicted permease
MAFANVVFNYPDYADLRDRNRSFSSLAAFHGTPMSVMEGDKPERVWGMLASENYFDVLDIKTVRGRGFFATDDNKPGGVPEAVISYSFWQSHYGGRDSAIGAKIEINLHPFTIVGVTPPSFQGTQTGLRSDIWIPLMMEQQLSPGPDLLQQRGDEWLFLFGRLRPGVSGPQAQDEVGRLMQQIAEQYPEAHQGRSHAISVYEQWRSPYGANRFLYQVLPTLMVIAVFVLLLACSNTANLLLVRSVTRRREIAIRLCIGAKRWPLIRQLLVESLLLALGGGLLAALLTTWTAGALNQFLPSLGLPIGFSAQPPGAMFLVTFILSLCTGLFFGMLPALRLSSLDPVSVLKEETGSTSNVHHGKLSAQLVVAQIALSLVALICAGLLIQSFINAQRFNIGFNPKNVLVASVDLFGAGYRQADGIEFQKQLVAKLETMPGVESATVASWVPLSVGWDFRSVVPEGYVPQPHESMVAGMARVGPQYFHVMQIPLFAGREFTLQDTQATQPVVVVNQTLAERYWPHQDVIGKRLTIGDQVHRIVGVAHNCSYSSLNESPSPFIYLPESQDYFPTTIIHVRISGPPLLFASNVEKTVHDLNASLPVFEVTALESRIQFASFSARMAGTLAGIFGLVALVLAAVGIYGVVAYTITQRTREIGIRVALGAGRATIFRLLMVQGLRVVAIGVMIGLALSLALTRFLSGLLIGVNTLDIFTFGGVTLLMSAVAMVACYIPAHRAMRIDPMLLLRCQ